MAARAGTPLEIRIVTAKLDHSPGDLEKLVIGGTSSDVDLLPTGAGGWSNDTITISPSNDTPNSLIFSGIYNVTTADGSGPMILGIVAPLIVYPDSGSTRFTGTGFVTGAVLNDSTAINAAGVSTVTVNWVGDVDARIDGIANDLFDTVTITGMTRSDAAFEGGVIALLEDGQPVTASLIGNTRTDTAAGGIYGALNDNSDAAEAGGVFLTTGESGVLGGGFIGTWESHN